MFKRINHLLFFVIIIIGQLFAQDEGIYVPPQVKELYNNGTRSWDGKPGADYWQNSSDYILKVGLDPDSGLISGEGKIIYYNNSPDTLNKIVIRLYQDIFKASTPRDYGIKPEAFTEGIELERLVVNGEELDPDTAGYRSYTNYYLKMPVPALPKSKTEIQIAWNFKLSTKTLRMGKYREDGFFIAYWYPQIAVYDDVDGWDRTEYSGSVEFYNDFNNYEVEITVPKNYLIRATGEMLNADEILKPNIYDRYLKALESDSVIRIITADDLDDGEITRDDDNTWKYSAKNVSDFTFASVKNYLWDGVSVIVDDETDRRTLADVLYKKGDAHYEQVAYFSKLTVDYLSNELPGVPFPYSHITAFSNGRRGGGMESPMMTNDGVPKDSTNTLSLLFHEIAHTYFPFYMGINERKYAWMDEGWASFLPTALTHRFNPTHSHYEQTYRGYKFIEGTESEVPLMILSKTLKGYPLMAAIYGRAYFAYVALADLLGAQLFKKAMKEYISRWHNKHPLPYDFFFTFDDVSGEDLSWFWKPWFYDFGYSDLGLEQNDDGDFIVKMIGNQPVPVEIKVVYDDGMEQIINESTKVWNDGNKEFVMDIDKTKKVLSIEINVEKIPDYNSENNNLEFAR
ncbi:MAG: M1 family metallopeptidase [Ignavibacteria bacterium]|nr:MAG: M1 family metallopeptidase [Ignavibacteria bacterium]